MKTIICTCDRCESSPGATVAFTVDRRADAAGGMEDVDLYADLCSSCKLLIFDALVYDLLGNNSKNQDILQQTLQKFGRKNSTMKLFTRS